VVGVPQAPGCTSTPIPVYGVRVSGSACTADVSASQVVKLGAELQTLLTYYTTDANGACVRQPQAGVFAPVGADVPTASLAVVVETVE
jgi:tagatose-1,6-bisphosphate aldolase